jgi:mannose-6-phosphate isomerase
MPSPVAFAIDGVIQHYTWGSQTAIPALLGTEPDGRPYAELWFGAHAAGPSPVPQLGRTLDDVICQDPQRLLGENAARRFGPRLPFLLKVLAARRCLSIQVHPTRAQAEEGYAAEDRAGVPLDSPVRNYRDTNHKPELLCALTDFQALCGFRAPAETDRLLAAFELAELAALRALLAGRDGLRAAFTYLLTLPDPKPLAAAIARHAPRLTGEWAPVAAAIALIADDFPGDVGVALALLLNQVTLRPGEAIYLPAGNVHAYLRGTGVEIMASSDNVLRCGLTDKHVDVAELCKITDFSALSEPRWPAGGAPGHERFEVPEPDFALTRVVEPAEQAPSGASDGPSIVLCTGGHVALEFGGGDFRADPPLHLAPGHAAFVGAGGPGYRLGGDGTAFVATPGSDRTAGR